MLGFKNFVHGNLTAMRTPLLFSNTWQRLSLRLLVWCLQLAVLASWLVYFGKFSAESVPLILHAVTWLALAAGAPFLAMLSLNLRIALIWRRRHSVRPSLEIQQERRRIAADLHDSVGSQLVQAMALLDGSDAHQRLMLNSLEHCLLDLRMVVDSMDADNDNLSVCLARLRHRLQPVLDSRGIAMDWSVPDGLDSIVSTACIPALPQDAPAQQLMRIAKEAISNILQHAHASKIRIALDYLPHEQSLLLHPAGQWKLTISDNGIGLPAHICDARCDMACTVSKLGNQVGSSGKGMTSMRTRARLLGARWEIDSNNAKEKEPHTAGSKTNYLARDETVDEGSTAGLGTCMTISWHPTQLKI